MADILIRGMEMPKYTTKAEFGIDADGNPLCMVHHRDGTEPDIYDVVPLPEGHGRLGDLDALSKEFERLAFLDWNQKAAPYSWAYAYSEAQAAVDDSPTIVPAEGGGEDGN